MGPGFESLQVHHLVCLGDTYNRIAFFLAFIAIFIQLNMLTIRNCGLILFPEFSIASLTYRVKEISP